MNKKDASFNINMIATNAKCAIGEKVAKQNIDAGKIPVLSCEGACIRGEIARMAANIIAKHEKYGRTCHGELFTMPDSGMTDWVKNSENIVLIDGCFIGCYKRIMENLFDKEKILHFNALSIYNKYSNFFDSSSVPYEELLKTAQEVANRILKNLRDYSEENIKQIKTITEEQNGCTK